MVIGKRQSGYLHVAAVGYLHCVRYSIADLNAGSRRCTLRYRQGRCRRFRRHRLTVIVSDCGILRIFAVRCGRVRECACIDVRLRHNIRRRHSRRLARGNRRLVKRAHHQARHRVGYRQTAHCYITGVLYRDRVSDRIVDFRFARLARALRYRQLCFRFFRIDPISSLISLAFQRSSYSIGETARSHIGGLNGVSRCCGYSIAGCNVFKRCLCERNAFDFTQRDRLGYGVDVLYCNIEGNRLAFGVFVIISFIIVLRDDE